MQAKDARSRPCVNAERERWAQADQRRSKQIKNWTYDDGPGWPPVNLANNSFDGARSGSPQQCYNKHVCLLHFPLFWTNLILAWSHNSCELSFCKRLRLVLSVELNLVQDDDTKSCSDPHQHQIKHQRWACTSQRSIHTLKRSRR